MRQRIFRISALAFVSFSIPHLFPRSHNTPPQIPPSKKPHFNMLDQSEIDSFVQKYSKLKLLNGNKSIEYLISQIRQTSVNCYDFRYYADRVIRLILEESIVYQDFKYSTKESPLGFYSGIDFVTPWYNFCAVTILRAGNSFLSELLHLFPGISIGQILVQRNEVSKEKEAILYYQKLPKKLKEMKVLLCDPMIGTGGSLQLTIDTLLEKGVQEENITIISIIGCKDGVQKIMDKYKNVKMVLGYLDPFLLKDSKYIAPGLGDFGDRYFGAP